MFNISEEKMRRYRNQYHWQKSKAKGRGIDWLFTFEEWLRLWWLSGKLEKRGRKVGQYCMCRKDDVGPYSRDNVYITTVTQNLLDQVKLRHSCYVSESREGVRIKFSSVSTAAKYFGITRAAVRYRIKNW